MTTKEKPPAGSTVKGAEGSTSCTVDPSAESETKQLLGGTPRGYMGTRKVKINKRAFIGLEMEERWVPFRMVWNPKREKWDKIPNNGQFNLSTSEPKQWTPMAEALERANNPKLDLSGVGFVMTGGLTTGGGADKCTLAGFDFDDVNFDKFKIPFKTYAEKSPSGKGVRMFAWVPTAWAKKYQDTLDCKPPNCDHCEIYLGTSARFLTVTFDNMNAKHMANLTEDDLKVIESWGLRELRETRGEPAKPIDDFDGTPADLSKCLLSEDQQALVDGNYAGDRSPVFYGLIIMLANDGISAEDILATIFQTEALWSYCLSHRGDDEEKAAEFAKDEVRRAWDKTDDGIHRDMIGYGKPADPVVKDPDAPESNPVSDPVAGPVTPEVSPTFPMELFKKAPGLVGEIAKWIMRASHAPREEFAYAVALSIVACLIGPHCTAGGSILNLYIALVGGTGTGKTEAMKAGLKLLGATEAKDSVSDFPASEPAMRRQLTITPNALIRVDELAHKFESLGKGDANGSGLSRAVLEAYDGDRMPPKPYADSHKTLEAVENPFVQILGGTTDKIWEAFSIKHLEDGTLNRFIFICLPDDPPYSCNDEPWHAVPKAFKDKLTAFWRAGRRDEMIGEGWGRKVEYDEEVKAALKALGPQVYERKQQLGEYGPLYGRFELHVSKIAAILAVGDGRLLVEMNDYSQALAFMTWSVETTLSKVSGTLAGSAFEKSTKQVVRLLQKAGGKLRQRDLYKGMNLCRREMAELLITLGMREQVRETKAENKNGTTTIWVELLS
ncbi:hypothetical protein NVV94_05650 [Pseudomonas sp. LS1212]|uniref:hypothetical protein n=1 Tax=Pseudomonas sp. LS1212 TaxID=2972478 RepID=UPI00215BB922|nr:hypothetical protein [Pseudomonas sp. LS1212]UVJ45066.1 hypothetical protein NVV94_05650 [Pseudomonas sp. LS1212]